MGWRVHACPPVGFAHGQLLNTTGARTFSTLLGVSLADLADAENALKGLIVGWCYPNGTSQESSVPGAIPVKVGRGWPVKDALMADLAAQVCNVTIYSQPGSERLTTRYPREWQTLSAPSPSITDQVSGNQITFTGTPSTGLNVAAIVNGSAYIYTTQPNDTLASVASAIAELIEGATSSGPTVTIPSATRIIAMVGGTGQMIRELRRQERLFQITCWCATPSQRDVLAGFIDQKFAGAGTVQGLEFITLPDGTAARLRYVRTAPTDKDELSGSWRRDLIYAVEYATTETSTAVQIVAAEAVLSDMSGDLLFDQTV